MSIKPPAWQEMTKQHTRKQYLRKSLVSYKLSAWMSRGQVFERKTKNERTTFHTIWNRNVIYIYFTYYLFTILIYSSLNLSLYKSYLVNYIITEQFNIQNIRCHRHWFCVLLSETRNCCLRTMLNICYRGFHLTVFSAILIQIFGHSNMNTFLCCYKVIQF